MKEHKRVTALLKTAEQERRCAIGDGGALYHALRRRVRSLEVVSPYPNLFARTEYWDTLNPEERSLHTIQALTMIHPRWTFAGLSAACVYRYQHSYSLHDGTVSIASSQGTGHGDTARLHRIYMHEIPRWKCRNIPVTSPARTLIDCAAIPFANALAIYDSALRSGHVTRAEVETLMIRVNCDEAAVKRLLHHANPLRENGGESWVYAHIVDLGYAEPLMQIEFVNLDNPNMPYRVDFCWKLADGRIIVAEYDGMAKYADAGNSGRVSLQAKLDYERRRERDLKMQGVTVVVHLFFEDVTHLERLEAKLTDAGVPKIR
ncbi:hypothetical protein JS533_011935 [Bifidobacterium amazonense]|uniref:CTP synthase n=1 Tax=Bifidobacterium amazonense TaxID=2809027 RepID=A0ABS9VYG1_9BIFI|nr:hypothetical protein [Bifidobacterium amazonense]MCH9276966.1 hypothetical protein [Bifidobacterium amazonense]